MYLEGPYGVVCEEEEKGDCEGEGELEGGARLEKDDAACERNLLEDEHRLPVPGLLLGVGGKVEVGLAVQGCGNVATYM